MTVSVSLPLAELRESEPLRLPVDERAVLVVLVDGAVAAYEDGCLHRGTSLADGVVRDCVVMCPGHFWRYDLRTGERSDAPGEPLPRVAVRVEGATVHLDLPDLPAPMSMRERLLAAARESRTTDPDPSLLPRSSA
ncbi:MAG: Rieske (2Fe-2S) protein [Candidatus Nanopelagicales bacterium]